MKVNVATLIMCRLTVVDNEGIIKVIVLLYVNLQPQHTLLYIFWFSFENVINNAIEVELYQSNIFALLNTGLSVCSLFKKRKLI